MVLTRSISHLLVLTTTTAVASSLLLTSAVRGQTTNDNTSSTSLVDPDLQQAAANAQLAAQSRICPEFGPDPLAECRTVSSYEGLRDMIGEAETGDTLEFCPFSLFKILSDPPITVSSGVTLRCVQAKEGDFCVINGGGTHMVISTSDNTLIQGFSFRGSDDHAVRVTSATTSSETTSTTDTTTTTPTSPTHSFCQTSFQDTLRDEETRGGTLMLDRNAGTVNLIDCFFVDNWTRTFGAAVYSRTNQLNVESSIFLRNTARGYGGAIFVASGGNLKVTQSQFLNNRGRDSYDIVINPSREPIEVVDEYDNVMRKNVANGVVCRGFYDMNSDTCTVFLQPTPSPTNIPTTQATPQTDEVATTSKPTMPPTTSPTTVEPRPETGNPTRSPTIGPTIEVTTGGGANNGPAPSLSPTKAPVTATTTPTTATTTTQPTLPKPTSAPTAAPVVSPTMVPTQKPVASPTASPTAAKVPTLAPALPTPFFGTPTLPADDNDGVDEGNENENNVEGDDRHEECQFDPFDGTCIEVQSFRSFKAAIEDSKQLRAANGKDVVFCGGFRLRKKANEETISIRSTMNIRCLERCTMFGDGVFMTIGGSLTQVSIENMKFMNSDSTAIQVETGTSLATTTFCDTEFSSNKAVEGQDGGAIEVSGRSGRVNVVDSEFVNNQATNGGAISFRGFQLSIIDSRFTVNRASGDGNAIYVGHGSNILVSGTEFILNSVQSGDGSSGTVRGEGDYAIVIESTPSMRTTSRTSKIEDGGSNTAVLNGGCDGFYNGADGECQAFVN